MTAAEKKDLARFLDLSHAYLHGGFHGGEREYDFVDDALTDDSNGANAVPLTAGNDSLESIANEIQGCTACPLCKTRTRAVPGAGSPAPLVMIIGEGPGDEEDASGRPFAGIAGERLDKMLAPIGLSRDDNCFLTGVVKCHTPDTRDPLPDETIACAAFLQRQILLLKPRIILCTGQNAAHSLLRTSEEIDTLRMKASKLRIGDTVFPVTVTWHPNDLWKNEELKRPAWEDLKRLRAWLDANAAEARRE
jgi:DNA polymerase